VNSQIFLRISMDVPKQLLTAMDLAARLRPRKHRQFLLSHYHSPQLHKVAVYRLLDLYTNPGICTILLTLTCRTRIDQSLARSLLYQPMYQLHLRRLRSRRDLKLTSLHLQLPRHLEH